MINVIDREGTNGKTYSNVNGITPVPAMIKSAGLPQAVNKNEIFNLSDPDHNLFNSFSENLKRKIESSPEWEKLSKPEPVLRGGDQSLREAEAAMDEVPF